jgi:hypothetical protein
MRWSKKNAILYTTSKFYSIRRKSLLFIRYVVLRIILANISHEHFSRTFLTNIFHEHVAFDSNCFVQSECWKSSHVTFYKNQFESYFKRNYSQQSSIDARETNVVIQEEDVLARFLCKRRRKNNTFDNSTRFENNEVSSYFAASLIKRDEKTLNVIEYWKSQETQYSLLVKMTKDVLAIFCFDVEVERLFNLARDVIIYRRERLNSQTIEIVMMIKYNLNNEELNDSLSSSNESFVDELSSNASFVLSLVLIENDASSEHLNENSQASDTALTKWENEKFSKEFFFDKSNHNCVDIRLTHIRRSHFSTIAFWMMRVHEYVELMITFLTNFSNDSRIESLQNVKNFYRTFLTIRASKSYNMRRNF